MKRNLLLLILVLSGLATSYSSSGQAPDWTRVLQVSTYGMQNADAISADASYIYIAASISGPLNAGDDLTSIGLRDMLVVKIANDETIQWLKQIDAGPGGAINALAIKADASGNVYVTGGFSGTATFGTSITLTSDATHNAFMAKFEPDGDALWATSFLNNGTAVTTKMAFDAGSNIYLVSRTTKLIKFNSSGVIQWEQNYPDNNNLLQAVAVYGSNLYLGGTLRSTTVNFGTIPLTPLGGNFTGYMVKADLNGDFSGSMVVGGSTTLNGSSVTDIATDNSGNLIITGCYTDDLILGTITIPNNPVSGYNYTYVAKCTDSFVFSWAQSSTTYQNFNNDMLNYRLFVDNSGNIYEHGPNASSFYYGTVPVASNGAPFLVEFDATGDPLAGYSAQGTSVGKAYVSPAGFILTEGSYTGSGNPNYGNFFIRKYSNSFSFNWELATSDSHSGTVQIRSVRHDAAGNTYIQARVLGYCEYFGELINTTNAVTVISKHDITGDMLWMRQIGDISADMFGQTFILDKDNNVLSVGLFQSSLNIESMTLMSSTSGLEGYVAKFETEDGNLEWAQAVDLGDDVRTSIAVASDNDGNVVISGTLNPENYLIKFSDYGDRLWSYIFPMDSEFFSLVSTDGDNNIYMASEIHLTSGSVMIGSVELTQTSDDGATVVVKFDPDGDAIWANTYGGVSGAASSDGFPTDIINDADGNTYLWGWCLNNAEFDGITLINPLVTPALYSYYLTKIDENGDVVWAEGVYETSLYSSNYGDMMDLDASGNIYVGGHFRFKMKIEDTEYTPAGTNDFFTVKFTNDGDFEWMKTVPSNGLICYALDVSEEDVLSIGSAAGKDASLGTFPYERKGGSTGIIGTLGEIGYVTVVADDPIIITAPASSTGSFDINSNKDWTIECDQTWLTPDVTSGTGDATITLTAEANTASAYRIAYVSVLRNDVLVEIIFAVQLGTPISTFPYTEDFTVFPPVDWNFEGDEINWEPYNSNSVYVNFWDNPGPASAAMVAPIFDFSAVANPEMNFKWSHKYYSGNDDELKIEVYADGPDWETVWSKSGSELNSYDGAQDEAPGTYTTTSLNLAAYAGKPFVMIRFNGISDYGPNLYIDQVIVYDAVKSAPEAVTGAAVYTYYDQAVMTGLVTPHSAQTAITFEYGLTDAYGDEADAIPATANGSVGIQVYQFLSGLTPNTTYHYRIVAVNSEGTDYGDDITFTTSGCDRIEYTTANEAGTYTDIGSSGTVISTVNFDDANSAPYDIGFTFNYNCQDFTQFVLNTNGFIKLGSAPPSAANKFFSGTSTNDGIFSSMDPADVNILAPFTMDLTAGTSSTEYRVYTSGVAPDRICTIQFKNVSDKTTYANSQYDNINFQIRLHETTNVIEYVYGTWTPSVNASATRAVECGIKGSAPVNDHLITISKNGSADWSSTTTQHSNYSSMAFTFGNPPLRPAPDPGRTYKFTPTKNNDATVMQVYTLTKLPISISGSHQVEAVVKNVGFNTLTDITVSLNISGANTFSDSKVIATLNPDNIEYITFNAFIPSVTGDNIVSVTAEDDDNNANNSRSVNQTVTSDTYRYAFEGYTSGSLSNTGLSLSRFSVTGSRVITGVNIFIGSSPTSIGNTVYAVVTDEWGNIAGNSPALVITPGDLGKMYNFTIENPPLITNNEFLAGLACTSPIAGNYFPIAFQNEVPVRSDTYFLSDLSGGYLDPTNYRFITEAVASEPSLNVSDNSLTIDQPDNSTETFDITSNMNWNVSSNQAWLTTSESNGSRDATITLTAEENLTGSDRFATVTVTGADGTNEVISVTQAGLATGVEKTEKTVKVNLYPNPNSGKFTLDLAGTAYDKLRITVTTSVGVVVRDLTLRNQTGVNLHEIDLGKLAGGIYFINIRTETLNAVKMFVVE